MTEIKYILEAEVKDKNSELVGRLRYFFRADDDLRAKGIERILMSSLKKGFSPYYGSNSVNFIGSYRLEELK